LLLPATRISHVGVEDVSPLAVLQLEDALDFLLGGVVVEEDINSATQNPRLGLFGKLFDSLERAQIGGVEFELGGWRVLLDILGEVLDILGFILVVVQKQGGSLVSTEGGSR
jgi:hypothetical protein